MSVLIKGMEIPKCCNECRFLEGDTGDGLCHAIEKWFDDEYFTWFMYEEYDIDDSKPSNCPLIEIPTPHGRLIDADILCEKFAELEVQALKRVCELGEIGLNEEWRKWDAILTERTACKYDVCDAPIIIEAEE